MICGQLEHLQNNFAALLVANDQQEALELQGMVPVENKDAVRAFREELQKRILAASSMLAAHIQEHGCAN